MDNIFCYEHDNDQPDMICLEDQCQDRLICALCALYECQDNKHNGHKRLIIKSFIKGRDKEMENIFGGIIKEIIEQNGNIKEQFMKRLGKQLDIEEDKLIQPIYELISERRDKIEQLAMKYTDDINVDEFKPLEQIKQNVKEVMDMNQQQIEQLRNDIIQYQKIGDKCEQTDKIIPRIQQENQIISDSIRQIIMKNNQYIDQIYSDQFRNTYAEQKDLYDNGKMVVIKDIQQLDQYKQKIEQHLQNNKKPKLSLRFYDIVDHSQRQQVIRWVDKHKFNRYVGILLLSLYDNDNQQDIMLILNWMISKCFNIFSICISDNSEQVDKQIHQRVLQWANDSLLLSLGIYFNNDQNNDEKLQIAKQYVSIMQKNDEIFNVGIRLEQKIDKLVSNRQQTLELIEEFNKIQ